MLRVILSCCLIACSFFSLGAAVEPVKLLKVRVNPRDQQAVLRGARFYRDNCMVCHTMRYLEFDALTAKAGISLSRMPLKNKEWSFGVVPPDLTLMAKIKSQSWLYTYFHVFYQDEKRPTGFNNLLNKNTNMINVFAPFQGLQVLVRSVHRDKDLPNYPDFYQILRLEQSGSMTPDEFDQVTRDLLAFLVYASDPHIATRYWVGLWVILFLVCFLVLCYALKRAYWRDIS